MKSKLIHGIVIKIWEKIKISNYRSKHLDCSKKIISSYVSNSKKKQKKCEEEKLFLKKEEFFPDLSQNTCNSQFHHEENPNLINFSNSNFRAMHLDCSKKIISSYLSNSKKKQNKYEEEKPFIKKEEFIPETSQNTCIPIHPQENLNLINFRQEFNVQEPSSVLNTMDYLQTMYFLRTNFFNINNLMKWDFS